MACTAMTSLRPYTQALRRVLQTTDNASSSADLLLLEAWESDRSMHLGIMLRVRQIRRANPQLSTEIAAELASNGKVTGAQVV